MRRREIPSHDVPFAATELEAIVAIGIADRAFDSTGDSCGERTDAAGNAEETNQAQKA
jgi:hypothetical protein